ncbi:hypothetical protein REC12_03995 [Desulfosporosinus sp. PR]|nr:hypothetical protein [Desulfosporosinus sp. PR]MDQ7092743.1 hypothetical protein [Desulfosporosinus sp. PR]
MSFRTSFSKMLSYIARCDPYYSLYYIPDSSEENEYQTNGNNDPKI